MNRPFPAKSLGIELTNRCSLRCSECWGRGTRPEGVMPWDLFTKVVDEAAAHGVKSASLHFNGDSALHPRFAEAIAYASLTPIHLNYSTNGLGLSDEVIAATVDGKVRRVNFSIHTDDALPLEAASRLRSARDRTTRGLPRIAANMLYDGSNAQKVIETWHRWRSVVDTFGASGTIEDMRWRWLPPFGAQVKRQPRCPFPLRYAAVLWDGRVTVCCHDLAGELAGGDVTKTSLWDALYEAKFMKMRADTSAEGRPREDLCRRCGLWQKRHRFASLSEEVVERWDHERA